MSTDSNGGITITGFDNVPDFARGQVRDLRVRWALEELDLPYRTDLLDAYEPRPDGYERRQPFGQVPAFSDGENELFETGAILLYLAERNGKLLPQDLASRWQAITWLFAALNSVEPSIMTHAWLTLFHADAEWAAAGAPAAAQFRDSRLDRLAAALGSREWLAGSFSIADIAMVTILRQLDLDVLRGSQANLATYRQRGEARPAFERALCAQLSDFIQPAEQVAELGARP